MIILFHRPPFAPDPETKVETPGTTTGVKHSDTFAVQSLKFSEEDGALKIHIDVIWKRKHTLSLDFSLKEEAGSVVELFYDSSRRRTLARNYLIVNPYSPTGGMGERVFVPVGRVHFEEGRVLVYLRGHYADAEGVQNQVLAEDQSSVDAMGAFSSEAEAVFKSLMAKRDFLADVDALDSTAYLEAQVDILTKIVLAAGLADGDELKAALEKADEAAIYRSNSKEKLLSKMADKAAFRKKQLAYYVAEQSLEAEEVAK